MSFVQSNMGGGQKGKGLKEDKSGAGGWSGTWDVKKIVLAVYGLVFEEEVARGDRVERAGR